MYSANVIIVAVYAQSQKSLLTNLSHTFMNMGIGSNWDVHMSSCFELHVHIYSNTQGAEKEIPETHFWVHVICYNLVSLVVTYTTQKS